MQFQVKCERSENDGKQATWETYDFTLFHEALSYMERIMAEWNNFYPHTVVQFTLRKVPDNTPPLHVMVNESVDSEDRFGG